MLIRGCVGGIRAPSCAGPAGWPPRQRLRPLASRFFSRNAQMRGEQSLIERGRSPCGHRAGRGGAGTDGALPEATADAAARLDPAPAQGTPGVVVSRSAARAEHAGTRSRRGGGGAPGKAARPLARSAVRGGVSEGSLAADWLYGGPALGAVPSVPAGRAAPLILFGVCPVPPRRSRPAHGLSDPRPPRPGAEPSAGEGARAARAWRGQGRGAAGPGGPAPGRSRGRGRGRGRGEGAARNPLRVRGSPCAHSRPGARPGAVPAPAGPGDRPGGERGPDRDGPGTGARGPDLRGSVGADGAAAAPGGP